jgi:hypothetical protein
MKTSNFLLFNSAFNPASLFRSGEDGAVYAPNDLSTLYQDSAGTRVTGLGQSIGMMIDARYGLSRGAQLVTNGDFTSNVDGWSVPNPANGTQAWSAGQMLLTISGATCVSQQTVSSLVVGATYTLSVNVSAFLSGGGTSSRGRVGYSGAATGTILAGGGQETTFVAATNSLLLSCDVADLSAWGSVGDYAVFDKISVTQLTGNHARQDTAGSRPTVVAGGTINYASGSKSLVASFAASLGSSCTVARAVAGVGASILTGQTIGTTYTDTTDHCGLVIINRALNPQETLSLTRYLKRKAGV